MKPWYRERDDAWYATLRTPDGKRHQKRLCNGIDNEAEAWAQLGLYKKGRLTSPTALTVKAAFDAFLSWAHAEKKPATFEFYRYFLQSFADHENLKAKRVSDLIPNHVTRWLQGKGWNSTTRNRAVSSVKRALNWCVSEGLLPENPLRSVKKDRMLRREKTITPEERAKIDAEVKDEAFRHFLFAMGQTGARSMEVRIVTAADVRDGEWVFRSKGFDRTGKLRHIYLTRPMAELTNVLCEKHPEGPLFQNSRGKPWTHNAIRIRFRNLRKKLGLPAGVVATAMRHTYITDALEAGVPIATLSELAGHSSTRMIEQTYSKLSERKEHLRAAAEKAVQKPSESTPSPDTSPPGSSP
jgi:integrase